MISAYESDRREPGIRTLSKLVAATGHQLVLTIVGNPGRALGLPETPLGRRLRRNRKKVLEAAARRGAHNVRVFGSVARGEDAEASDIDLLVDLDDGVGVVGLAGLARELTDLLDVHVDVVPVSALKRRFPSVSTSDEALAEALVL